MKIETWILPPADASAPVGYALSEPHAVSLAVVIDVLRATTVITTALAAGARRVITCRDVETAHRLRDAGDGESTRLLCGERQCRRIDGFDFGNSPGEYSPAKVAGRELVMTTTNGTAAIDAAAGADDLILACFANLSAVVEFLTSRPSDVDGVVRIVCAGTDGAITTEDVLVAGALIAACHGRLSDSPRFHDGPIKLTNDAGMIALAVWQHSLTHEGVSDAETLAARLAATCGGRNLIAAGFESDLVDCAAIDVFDNVPRRVRRDPAAFENA